MPPELLVEWAIELLRRKALEAPAEEAAKLTRAADALDSARLLLAPPPESAQLVAYG
jgi:hypothetical protein